MQQEIHLRNTCRFYEVQARSLDAVAGCSVDGAAAGDAEAAAAGSVDGARQSVAAAQLTGSNEVNDAKTEAHRAAIRCACSGRGGINHAVPGRSLKMLVV